MALALVVSACSNSPEAQSIARRAALTTARTPEGAKGGDVTIFNNQPRVFAIHTGSGIHINQAGLTLIENFEEIQKAVYCPYYDVYGHVSTRGFGETDWSDNFGGRCISHAQAVANLANFVESKYQYAVRALGVPLTQNQVNALDSFVWNLGAGIFNGTSVGADLRSRHYYAASVAMLSYDRAGGQVLGGLVARRHAEFRVFNTPDTPEESAAQHAAKVHKERVTKLHNDYKQRQRERSYLAHHNCRKAKRPLPRPKPHTQRQKRLCAVVKSNGDRVHSDIADLHRKGV